MNRRHHHRLHKQTASKRKSEITFNMTADVITKSLSHEPFAEHKLCNQLTDGRGHDQGVLWTWF